MGPIATTRRNMNEEMAINRDQMASARMQDGPLNGEL